MPQPFIVNVFVRIKYCLLSIVYCNRLSWREHSIFFGGGGGQGVFVDTDIRSH